MGQHNLHSTVLVKEYSVLTECRLHNFFHQHSSELYLISTSVIDVSDSPHHLSMNLCISMTNMSLACLNAVCSHVVFCACKTVE